MDEERREKLATIGAKIIGIVMVAFTIWLVATILFDPGPGPCMSLGGC